MVRAHGRRAGGLLEPAGYTGGDLLQTVTVGADTKSDTTSSSSYGTASSHFDFRYRHDTLFTADTTVHWVLCGRVIPGSTTMDVRVRNLTDSETVIEGTGFSSTDQTKIAEGDYTPTTTSDVVRYRVQIKNGDNSTQVELQDAVLFGPPSL